MTSGGNFRHPIWQTGVLPAFKIDDDLIKLIKEKYDDLIEDPEKSFVRGSGLSRSLASAHLQIPEISKILNENAKSQIQQFYGTNFSVRHVIAFRNYHVPVDQRSKQHFSELWHYDERDISCLKLFVNISEVSEHHGPFHILPVSSSKEMLHQGYRDRKDYGNAVPDTSPGLVKAIGPSGSALWCNTQICLHRAGLPSLGRTRDIIQFQFFPTKSSLPRDWTRHVQLKAAEKQKTLRKT